MKLLPAKVHAGPMIESEGSPEGTVPSEPGRTYHDTLTDDLYIKMYGVQATGWLKIGRITTSASTSSAAKVFSTNVDPNGAIEATGPALCLGYGAMSGGVWAKTTSGTSDDDWTQIIAPG